MPKDTSDAEFARALKFGYIYGPRSNPASHNGEKHTTMKNMLILLALCALAPALKAKIAIANSIEWLTVDADHIITGKLTITGTTKGKGNSVLTLCVLEETGRIKSSDTTKRKTWHFAVADYHARGLEELKDKEVLIFLRGTVEAFSSNGKTYNLWPMDAPQSQPAIIDLSAPGTRAMTARGFKVLKKKEEILEHCSYALEKLKEYKSKHPEQVHFKEAKLDVPFENEVSDVLYSGSVCYLIVPKFMFTEAKEE